MVMQRRLRIMSSSDDAPERPDVVFKVAFATTDMKHVNQHFGAAKSFAIYAVGPEGAALEEAAQFGELKMDGNEDKLVAKIDMLKECAAIYCNAVGGSAIRQLMTVGIQPVKVSEDAEIATLLRDLQAEIAEGPSSWVAKAIKANQGPDMARFDDMESEGWDE